MADTIRLVLIDDHGFILEGVAARIDGLDGIELVASSKRGEDAERLMREHAADIVILDLSLPDIGGIEITQRLLAGYPDLGIIILTMHDEHEYVMQAAHAGARGYVLKTATPAQLEEAIRAVSAGGSFFSPELSPVLVQGLTSKGKRTDRLSPRERQVLRLISEGRLNKQIAADLSLSVRTVETYRERLISKLGAKGTADLIRMAISGDLDLS